MQYLLLLLVTLANGEHFKTNMMDNRTTIVHLFEWKWKDIADECERFLAPEGFGGVQISPPSENLIIHINGKRPWYERYQVMSYKLETRSGNEDDFLNMTTRCNNVGVRIYADVVVNHMTGSHKDNVGTGGSRADFNKCSYPAVPYSEEHFHPFCMINNYYNATEVRNCQLLGLKDLNQTEVYVRNRIVSYVNKLIKLGVAGVRIDAAKHMWPSDLREIYARFDNLNPQFGFPRKSRPYIYQEVIYHGGEPIRPEEYTPLGDVTEFRVGSELKNVFRGYNNMKWLVNWGEQWGLSSGNTALVFIDNHDTQRSSDVLTYKEAKTYKAAISFILAHPYGKPRIMSSYSFTTSDQGPPDDGHENILSPIINQDDTCGNGWVCEHRWRQIYQMVGFRNAIINTNLQNWWDNGYKQIAFGRGGKGFIVFNGDSVELKNSLQTGLPAGEYCDIISGTRVGSFCTGKKISVNSKGNAHFFISPHAEDMHIAIHIGEESFYRIVAAKHMWPSDLREIYTRFNNLNPQFGFPRKSRPYIYQEVIYHGGEPIRPEEYTPLGDVTEFRTGLPVGEDFHIISGTKVGSYGPGKIISGNNIGKFFEFEFEFETPISLFHHMLKIFGVDVRYFI